MAEWTGKHDARRGVVVVTRDGPVFAKGYGLPTSRQRDVTAMKRWCAGSISKLFTAIAVMQLVDAVGSISIATLMATSISRFDPQGGCRHAAPSVDAPRRLRRACQGCFPGIHPEPLGAGSPKTCLGAVPNGDVEAYSNYGVALAICRRTRFRRTVRDYMQRHILDPLGMSHSTFRSLAGRSRAADAKATVRRTGRLGFSRRSPQRRRVFRRRRRTSAFHPRADEWR